MKHSCSLLNSAFRTSKYELLLRTEYLPSRHFHITYGWLGLAFYMQNILHYVLEKHIFLSVKIIYPSPWSLCITYIPNPHSYEPTRAFSGTTYWIWSHPSTQ